MDVLMWLASYFPYLLYIAITTAVLMAIVMVLAVGEKIPKETVIRFQTWLYAPFTVWDFVYFVVLYLFWEVADFTLGGIIIFGVPPPDTFSPFHLPAISDAVDVFILFIGVSLEEMFFRIIPLLLAMRFWGVSLPMTVVLVASSLVFGVAHGNILNIFIQGGAGLFFGLFFIKLSEGGKRPWRAAIFVILLHFAYDMLLGAFGSSWL